MSRRKTRSQLRQESRQMGSQRVYRRNDPMRPVYFGLVISIALIFGLFALVNVKQQRDYASAVATPTPSLNSTRNAVQLQDGAIFGKVVFPDGDVSGGGFGAPVDTIRCQGMEMARFHIHSHLELIVNGSQVAIPKWGGFAKTALGGCLYWVHTHDASGIIHIEAPEINSYTLGNFFDVWGQHLSRSSVGPFKGYVRAFVNGTEYHGTLTQIPLAAHQQITLEVGTPVLLPQNYLFQAND